MNILLTYDGNAKINFPAKYTKITELSIEEFSNVFENMNTYWKEKE